MVANYSVKYNDMKKKKLTPKQAEHQEIFDFLQRWGTISKRMPIKVLEALDVVSDYAGDIAMGRRK